MPISAAPVSDHEGYLRRGVRSDHRCDRRPRAGYVLQRRPVCEQPARVLLSTSRQKRVTTHQHGDGRWVGRH